MNSISVVIDDLNVAGALLGPNKANTSLIVDANTVLPGPASFERFQSVAGWRAQKFERIRAIEHLQLAFSGRFEVRKSRHAAPFVKGLGIRAPEAFDHRAILYRLTLNVKDFSFY